ncbi:MAG: AhpC/TSA family protein [Muribaculaceae bacterium]|nr:AhpC/TSA family protein [Muribaculaceae bacterium]
MKSFASYLRPAALIGPVIFLAASCGSPQYRISGEISGGADRTVRLERADYVGEWITLDSTRTDSRGAFTFTGEAPAAPEIYRLVMDGRYIYLPVDSTETVTVKADAANFGSSYTLSGSPEAETLASFERELSLFAPHSAKPDSAAAFKRRVFARYLHDARGSVTSYYILTKTLDGKPLFDPSDGADYGYFTAVATAFREFRPSDPRTPMLEETAMKALRERNAGKGSRRVVEAPETGHIEISLPDETGASVTLSSLLAKGRPVILAFTALSDPASPDENRVLNTLRGNAEIYMVGLDADIHAWREAAKNLPWVTVYDTEGSARAASAYNVSAAPAYYVFDAAGNLKSRHSSASSIKL